MHPPETVSRRVMMDAAKPDFAGPAAGSIGDWGGSAWRDITAAFFQSPLVPSAFSRSTNRRYPALDPSAVSSQPRTKHGNRGIKVNRSVKAQRDIKDLKVMTFGTRGTEAFSALR